MTKKLIWCSIFLLPLFANAQDNQVLIKDFAKKVKDITASVIVNDHENIMQIKLDDDNFELVAMDDKMKVLWRNTYKGSAVTFGKFKGHLLAITGSYPYQLKQKENIYAAYLIDENSGKILLQHDLYKDKAETVEDVHPIFSADGSGFTLVIRQTKLKNRFSIVFSLDALNDTKGLILASLNDKLEPTVSYPEFEDGTLASVTAASDGSYFLFCVGKDNKLKISKFEAGKNQSSLNITQDINMREKSDIKPDLAEAIPSETDRNIVYFSMIHKSPDKEMQLTLVKADFNLHTAKVVHDPLTKDRLKPLIKTFVPPNKEIEKADISNDYDHFKISSFTEYKNTLMVTFSNSFLTQFAGRMYYINTSTIIDIFDNDLNKRAQQIMPTWGTDILPALHFSDNSVYLLSNYGQGHFDIYYGQLDLSSGQWLKLQKLGKKNIDKGDNVTNNNLWYKDNFVIVYRSYSNSPNSNVDLTLQQNLK